MRPANVTCYSGHRYGERPLSFTLEGATYRVNGIENECLDSGKRRFRIRTENGEFFELCYDEQKDEWLVT